MSYQIQLRSDTSNNWTTVNPILAQAEAGYENDTGNLKIGNGTTEWSNLPYFAGSGGGGNANYGNSNVLSFLASGNTGNIIPSGNAIYSLGNVTNQWKDLWISGNTIYIETIPISLNSNSDLTVNGNPVVTANANANGATNVNELSVAGNVSAASANIGNTTLANGNVTASYFIGDGSQLSNINYANIPGAYSNSNVAAYLASSNTVINTSSVVSNTITSNTANISTLTSNVITSNVINVTTVNATGNIDTTGVFNGNGAGLTGIPYSALVGAYSNSNVANYLPTYSGELAAGNSNVSGEVVAGGNITAQYYYGNIFYTTGGYGNSDVANFLPTYGGNILANNITANTATIDGTVDIGGNLNVAGNTNYTNVTNLLVDDPLIYAGANNITNIVDQGLITPFNNGTQQYGGFVREATSGTWKLFANVIPQPNTTVDFANATYVGLQAGFFVGDGGNLSNINAANITGNLALSNANISGSMGVGANITAGGNITANGNITAAYLHGDGSNISNIQYSSIVGAYGDSNVATYLPTNTSNVSANYFIGDGSQISNINYANIPGAYGNANVAAYLASSNTVINTTSIVSNTITSNTANISTLTSNTITSNTANIVSLTSNTISAGAIGANTISANLFTGNGAGLTGIPYSALVGAYSNSNVANYLPTYTGVVTASDVTASATITANRLTTGDLALQGSIISSVSTDLTLDPGNDGLSGGNVIIAGNLQVVGNVTYVDVTTANSDNLVWVAANNASSPSSATGGGLAVGPLTALLGGNANTGPYASLLFNSAKNVWVSSLPLEIQGGANLDGAITGATDITANGNITGAYFIGDGSNLSNIQYSTIVGAYGNSNVEAYLANNTSNVTSNVVTSNTIISNVANVTTLNANTVTANLFSGNGAGLTNIPASSIVGGYANSNVASYLSSNTVATDINTTANISATYFIGDGGFLTNVSGGGSNYSNANVASYLPTDPTIIAITSNVANTDSNVANLTTSLANTDSNVGNLAANIATLQGQVYANSNVASYLLTNTGNISAGNVSVTGDVTADFFIGDGSLLSNINYANISGAYANSNVANYLPTYTGVVTANNVSVSSNVTITNTLSAGNIDTGVGNINIKGNTISTNTANIIIDPGNDGLSGGNLYVQGNLQVLGNITYVSVTTANSDNLIWQAANNASTSVLADGGGLAVGPAGNSYATWLFNNSTNTWNSNIGVEINGDTSIYGDLNTMTVTANSFTGDGGNLSNINAANIIGGYSNSNVASYLLTNSGNISAGNIVVTKDIYADAFLGDGGFLSNINIGNIAGSYSNSNVASYLLTNTGNISAGYFIGDGSQLTGLPAGYSNSNVASYLLTNTGNISAGNISASYFIGNGALLTGLPVGYANSNVAAYLPTYTGVVTASNVTSTLLSAGTGNLQISNNLIQSSNTTITIDPGNDGLSGGNLVVAGNLQVTGNVTYVSVTTAASDNLIWQAANNASTSALADGGGLAVGPAGNSYATFLFNNATNSWNSDIALNVVANVTAPYFIGNGALLTGITAGSNYANSNVADYLASNTITSNIITQSNIVGYGAVGGGSIYSLGVVTAFGNVSGDALVGNTAHVHGLATLSNVQVDFNLTANGNITAGNIIGNGQYLSNINIANIAGSYANSNVADYLPTYTGNITAGNANVSGIVNAAYFIGDGSNISNLNISNAVGGYGNSNVANYLPTYTGDLTAGNANVTGNVTGANIIGNGQFLSNINIGNIAGSYANSNVADYLPTYSGNISANNITVTNETNLGNIANITITGGNSGDVVITDGAGNLSFGTAINAIPAVYFAAPITGNNQTFSNAILSAYAANTDITLFYNGVLLENSFYTLSGDTITVNTQLNAGDTIDIIQQFAGTYNTIVNNSYGNANVASYLPTYSGNISGGNVNISGLFSAPQKTVTSSSPGVVGQICWDSSYIYICTATNTWARTALTGGF